MHVPQTGDEKLAGCVDRLSVGWSDRAHVVRGADGRDSLAGDDQRHAGPCRRTGAVDDGDVLQEKRRFSRRHRFGRRVARAGAPQETGAPQENQSPTCAAPAHQTNRCPDRVGCTERMHPFDRHFVARPASRRRTAAGGGRGACTGGRPSRAAACARSSDARPRAASAASPRIAQSVAPRALCPVSTRDWVVLKAPGGDWIFPFGHGRQWMARYRNSAPRTGRGGVASSFRSPRAKRKPCVTKRIVEPPHLPSLLTCCRTSTRLART